MLITEQASLPEDARSEANKHINPEFYELEQKRSFNKQSKKRLLLPASAAVGKATPSPLTLHQQS